MFHISHKWSHGPALSQLAQSQLCLRRRGEGERESKAAPSKAVALYVLLASTGSCGATASAVGRCSRERRPQRGRGRERPLPAEPSDQPTKQASQPASLPAILPSYYHPLCQQQLREESEGRKEGEKSPISVEWFLLKYCPLSCVLLWNSVRAAEDIAS